MPFWRSLRVKYAMTYLVIVAAVVVLLNTYPVMVTQTLAYQSKQTSCRTRPQCWLPPWLRGRKP